MQCSKRPPNVKIHHKPVSYLPFHRFLRNNRSFPPGLFVIVSWISFLIPMDVIPGRMALLVTLFLVLVNIFNTVTTNTPKVGLPNANPSTILF